MGLRQAVQSVLDRLQFYFDVFPGLEYQPLPWLGLPNARRRGTGTVQRWRAIEKAIARYPCSSAIDLGCDVGLFSFSMASLGIPVLAVDNCEHSLA
jgi:hypothetical protein